MYKVKDNAESQLQFGISSVATTLVVKEGQGAKFPEVPFLVVLNKRNSDGEITKSEKVEVSAVSGDQFTISRGYEGTTPSDFSADDFVSLFVLAKHIEELQTEVVKKANQTEVESVAQKTSTLEEKLSTAEGQISQLVEAGTPSYLSVKGRIRENYTLTDYIGIQNINTAEEVFLEPIAFGDSPPTEEIHICRLGSGINTNQLQIKLAKKGYPTQNVEVEIKKGEYNEDRGGRYGIGEVLAHASINSSSITAEPTTITVPLNQSLLFAENDKYVVILRKRGGNIDANNHYLVYADITQYSNVLGYIYNMQASGKNYGFQIIYCHSEGFRTSTLAKKSFGLFSGLSFEKEVYRVWGKTKKLSKSNNWQPVVIWNPPYDGVYTIHSPNLTGGNCRVTIDGEALSMSGESGVILKKRQTVRLERMNPYDYAENFTIYFLVKITQGYKLDRISTLGLPVSQVNKDEELEVILSGEHNTHFMGGLIELPKTTVTTGNIPLGNAVGFIPYVLPSGRIIHLPFYE